MSGIKDKGLVNAALFPAPTCTYSTKDFPDKLIFLPTTRERIVCLFMPYREGVKCINIDITKEKLEPLPLLIYLHGNGEDLSSCYEMLAEARDLWKVHTAAVEYPGYGLSSGKACESGCNRSANAAVAFFTTEMKIPASSIIIFGRSIGTGVATELCASFSENNTPLGGLILMSPYLSIKSLAKSLVGSVLGSLILNRFNNKERIKKVSSPILIIHGEEDELIPVEHAKVLLGQISHDEKTLLVCPGADHNRFDYYNQVYKPIQQFLENWFKNNDVPKTPYELVNNVFIDETLEGSQVQQGFISKLFAFSTGLSASSLEMTGGASAAVFDDNPRVDNKEPE